MMSPTSTVPERVGKRTPQSDRPERSPLSPILLYSGWQTSNIGDVGHTPGTLRYLEESCPSRPVIVWLCKGNPQVHRMISQRFPHVEIVQGMIDDELQIHGKELRSAFDRVGFFIQNSGMHFNHFWGGGPVSVLKSCISRDIKFGLYGHSFDGFSPAQEELMRGLLSQAEFIFTRDARSLETLRKAKISPRFLDWVPDGCFGIDVHDDRAASMYLHSQKLAVGRYLCVTLRTHSPKLDGRSDSLNPAQISERQLRQNDEWARKLSQVIVSWVERTGMNVLLTPEVDKEIAQSKELIYDRLPKSIKPYVCQRCCFWNVEEAVSIYSKAAALVSMEPHSCIMALSQGTPAIHWRSQGHGIKGEMFRDMGLGSWLFDIDEDSADSINEELARIGSNPAYYANSIKQSMDLVHERSLNGLRHVMAHQPSD